MIVLTKKPSPALLLVPLLLSAPGCASPGASVEDDGTSPSTGEDEPEPEPETTTGTSPTTADETGLEPVDTGSSDAGTGDSGSSDSGSSDSGSDPSCGNGIVEADEDCDGIDLAGGTCEALGLGAGTLSCSGGCRALGGDGDVRTGTHCGARRHARWRPTRFRASTRSRRCSSALPAASLRSLGVW